jgi:hypothetical protein
MTSNSASLGESIGALIGDERFTDAVLKAGRETHASGRETDFAVMENDGEVYVTEPEIGREERVRLASWVFREANGDSTTLFDGHFHTGEDYGSPSNSDLDAADVCSINNRPLFAVCTVDGGEKIYMTLYRRRQKSSASEYLCSAARHILNRALNEMFGSDAPHLEGTNFRRFWSAYRRGMKDAAEGRKNHMDVAPDALEATGVYEALTIELEFSYRK